VAIHQIPVSLSLAAIFRESKFKRSIQISFVALFALAAPIGFMLSDVILAHLSPIFTGLITAFA
jgi:zinc transporter ZupT